MKVCHIYRIINAKCYCNYCLHPRSRDRFHHAARDYNWSKAGCLCVASDNLCINQGGSNQNCHT